MLFFPFSKQQEIHPETEERNMEKNGMQKYRDGDMIKK